MPPFEFVDVKAFVFHGVTQHFAMPPLQRGPAGITGIGADPTFRRTRRPCRSAFRSRDRKDSNPRRSRDCGASPDWGRPRKSSCRRASRPKTFWSHTRADRHRGSGGRSPLFQLPMGAQQRFRRGALHKCARLRIDRSAQEIVGRGVANIELDRGIERREIDQIRLAKIAGFSTGG